MIEALKRGSGGNVPR